MAAVTYNPITDELFTAEKGAGAFLNNQRLRVASRKDIHEALIGCGIPHRGGNGQAEHRAELALLQAKAIGIRRLGSATLDLAYVAAGRLDAFWERNLHPWDLAAGILLIREAGGFTSDCDSEANPLQTGNIVAANADLLPLLKKELAAAQENHRRLIHFPKSQSIGSWPCATRNALALENGREPKNPLCADNGDGCAEASTRCRVRSTNAAFFCA